MPINYDESVETLLAPLESFVVANPRTLAGEVIPEHVNASFATPGGSFPEATCRSYRHAALGLRMLIGTRVSTSYALMIRVLGRREEQAPNSGATIQFGLGSFSTSKSRIPSLFHRGIVQVVRNGHPGPVPRQELLQTILTNWNEEAGWYRLRDFKRAIGTTSGLATLLDRLFLYGYLVEQAKRHLRGQQALDRLL